MGDLGRQIGERTQAAAERLARVGEVIAHGPIPANVIEVVDHSGDPWVVNEQGLWSCTSTRYADFAVPEVRARYSDISGADLQRRYPPLKVTKVRAESAADPTPSGLCEVGPDRWSCIVTDPIHRRIYHGAWGETEAKVCPAHGEHPHDERICLDCPICRPPASEPQHAGAPVDPRYLAILDRHADREHNERGSVATALAEILALHADDVRAELVPPYEQARSMRGLPLWIHECGAIDDRAERPGPFACSTLGCTKPWRPLLVGGATARKPRTWPALDGAPTDAQLVEVAGRQFTSADRGAHWDEVGGLGGFHLKWATLRSLGEVREVLA